MDLFSGSFIIMKYHMDSITEKTPREKDTRRIL